MLCCCLANMISVNKVFRNISTEINSFSFLLSLQNITDIGKTCAIKLCVFTCLSRTRTLKCARAHKLGHQ